MEGGAQAVHTPQNILIPTDLSFFSLEAVQYGQDIAELFDAKVTILYVDDRYSKAEMVAAANNGGNETESERWKELVNRIQQLLINNNLAQRSVQIDIRFGSAGREIVNTALEQHSDLIVISTHGRTDLRHVFLGSVAREVVRLAKCPVLTVKPEDIRELVVLTETDLALSFHISGNTQTMGN